MSTLLLKLMVSAPHLSLILSALSSLSYRHWIRNKGLKSKPLESSLAVSTRRARPAIQQGHHAAGLDLSAIFLSSRRLLITDIIASST